MDATQLPNSNEVLLIGGSAAAAGAAVEHMLEKLVMDHVPAAAKPWIPVLILLGGGTYAGMQAGLTPLAAFLAALTAYATAITKHDIPALTSAAVPEKPKDDGMAGNAAANGK